MNIFSYVLLVVGILMVLLGLIVWKKQKLSLISGYNSRNVKEEDIKDYTEAMGKAYIMLGVTMLIMEIFELMNLSQYGIIIWIIGFCISLTKITRTQKKYGTGIWN